MGLELAPTLLAHADKVIEITMLFAAALRVATGIKRACRDALLIVRVRDKADMGRRSVPIISDAIDPKRTCPGSKSRSAAVCCRAVCYRRPSYSYGLY